MLRFSWYACPILLLCTLFYTDNSNHNRTFLGGVFGQFLVDVILTTPTTLLIVAGL